MKVNYRPTLKDYSKIFIVIILLSVIGLASVQDYGISSDEISQMEMVKWNLQLIRKGTVIPGDLTFYGPVFNVVAEVFYQFARLIHDPQIPDENLHPSTKLLGKIRIKHYFTFLFSLICYLSVSALLGTLIGWQYAWLGPLILGLFPRFWGHSFFNPKDIPFATLFTLTTYQGTKLLNSYFICKTEEEIYSKNIIKRTIRYGFLLGILCGIRIGGFVLLFFLITTHFILTFCQRKLRNFLQFKKHYILLFSTWQAATAMCFPSIWFGPFVISTLAASYFGPKSSIGKYLSTYRLLGIKGVTKYYPILFFLALGLWYYSRLKKFLESKHNQSRPPTTPTATLGVFRKSLKNIATLMASVIFQFSFGIWFVSAVFYLSKHSWTGDVLFEGKFYSSHHLPWYYIPKWFLVTTPIPIIITFFLGLTIIAFNAKKFSIMQKSVCSLVLMQLFALPLSAIILGSTIYDGIRHFLFIIPAIAVISSIGFIWLYTKISKKIIKSLYLVLFLIMCIQITSVMLKLHPYEYIYFNESVGGLKGAYQKYETDYWGLSIKEAIEWINVNYEKKIQTIATAAEERVKLLALPKFNVYHVKWNKTTTGRPITGTDNLRPPFYYVARQRWRLQEAFPYCTIVFKVSRCNVPLCVVKRCD